MVTHIEKWEHLPAGEYLVDGVGKKNLDINGMLQWSTGIVSTVIDLNAPVCTEPKWYDNIPKKVFCVELTRQIISHHEW